MSFMKIQMEIVVKNVLVGCHNEEEKDEEDDEEE